jgi:hypothetical protein
MDGLPVDRVFIGSCTNSRLDDIRAAAAVVRGRKAKIPAFVSPGSTQIKREAEAEGLHRIFLDAGIEWRASGCSMCVGTNGDLLKPGERSASTSNRNFEGRQGRGARLTASWRSGSTVRGETPGGDLVFSDLATVDIRLFDTFSGSPDLVRRWPFLKGARVTLAVDNLFDARLEARDAQGRVPAGYAPDVLDPVGRVFEVSFRKVF